MFVCMCVHGGGSCRDLFVLLFLFLDSFACAAGVEVGKARTKLFCKFTAWISDIIKVCRAPLLLIQTKNTLIYSKFDHFYEKSRY